MPPLDHVTALAPRADLEAALARLTADAEPLALAICDVVGLKAVNERDGFLAGDAVLAAAAVRLRHAAAAATLVARLGGDELVGVFTGRAAGTSATAAAADLAAPGAPPLRSAAVTARPGEQPGPLLARLYAALRGR